MLIAFLKWMSADVSLAAECIQSEITVYELWGQRIDHHTPNDALINTADTLSRQGKAARPPQSQD